MGLTEQKIRTLINELGSHDGAKRRFAAEELSAGDERAVYPLIKALKDKNHGVQDAAMRSLIEIGGEITAYMVLPLLREDAFLRNTAVIILQEIGAAAIPLLGPLFSDKDDDIRKFALDMVCEIGVCDRPEALIDILKTDPNPNVRVSAAKALGVLHYAPGVPALIDSLRDTEWVCFSALEALSSIKDNSSVEAVAELLYSPSEAVRSEAIQAAASIATEDALSALKQHLEWEEITDFEKRLTIRGLLSAGVVPESNGSADTMLGLLIDGDWDDKMMAFMGLSAIKDERALFYVLDAAGDPGLSDPDQNFHEIKSELMNFGKGPLLALLQDGRLKFKGMTFLIELLGEMRCAEAVPLIKPLLGSNLYDIKRASARALREIEGGPAAFNMNDNPGENGESIC